MDFQKLKKIKYNSLENWILDDIEYEKSKRRKICKDFDLDCLDMSCDQCLKCWLHDVEDYCIMILE